MELVCPERDLGLCLGGEPTAKGLEESNYTKGSIVRGKGHAEPGSLKPRETSMPVCRAL